MTNSKFEDSDKQEIWLMKIQDVLPTDLAPSAAQLAIANDIMLKGREGLVLGSVKQKVNELLVGPNEKQAQRALNIMRRGLSNFNLKNESNDSNVISLESARQKYWSKQFSISDCGIRAAASDGGKSRSTVITIDMNEFVLSIIPFEDEPEEGEIELKVKAPYIANWERKQVKVLNSGGQVILEGAIIRGGLDSDDIDLSTLQDEMAFAVIECK